VPRGENIPTPNRGPKKAKLGSVFLGAEFPAERRENDPRHFRGSGKKNLGSGQYQTISQENIVEKGKGSKTREGVSSFSGGGRGTARHKGGKLRGLVLKGKRKTLANCREKGRRGRLLLEEGKTVPKDVGPSRRGEGLEDRGEEPQHNPKKRDQSGAGNAFSYKVQTGNHYEKKRYPPCGNAKCPREEEKCRRSAPRQ